MKNKPLIKVFGLLAILVLGLAFVQTGLAGKLFRMITPGGEIAVDEPDVSAVGGYASVDSMNLLSSSRPPSHMISEDYQTIHTKAATLLSAGVNFRINEISIVPADTITNALKNYADFNNGDLFYGFCADYDQIDERGYCPPGVDELGRPRENVRNKLVQSLELYAGLMVAPTHVTMQVDGQEVSVNAIGQQGILSAAREIANAHLIFGNEFLVDATDYRFSTGGIPNADIIIGKELDELEMALQQFQLATDILSYAFNEPLGGKVRDLLLTDKRIGDYFTSREFELFGVASNRMMTTLGEMATRYHVLGQRDKAVAIYDQAFTIQYMQTMALAQQAATNGTDYLQNGSWEMLNNLSQMRERAQAIRGGMDPFGFTPDYVPLQPYEDLLELTEGPNGNTGLLGTARDLEDQARAAQRDFDENGSAMTTELDNLTVELSDQLFDLCGESNDEDGDGFGDYDTCEGGLMGQNLEALYAGSLRVGLAFRRARIVANQIVIEQERAGQVINVNLGLGRSIAAADLAIGKLEAYKETATIVDASEDQTYQSYEAEERVYTKVEATVSSDPFDNGVESTSGIEISFSMIQGYKHSSTHTESTELLWDPNAEEIGQWESIKALKEAEAAATIEGANSAAVIKNLLLQESESLLEYEIALAEFNKVVAEGNHLAQLRSRLLNKRALAINRVVAHNSHLVNPAYRIMRDTLTVKASEAHAQAAQFAYLTAKAVEYDLLMPYPDIGKIYKARTSNDIRAFLDDLKIYYQAAIRPGQLNRYPYTISIARDILGLTDQNLDPDNTMTEDEIHQLRYERFQEFLQTRVFNNTQMLEFQFGTSLDQRRTETQYLFSPNLWVNRIAGIGAPLTDNQGVSINIVTRQTSDVGRPEVVLKHDGQSSYRNLAGEIVYYDPNTAVPVGYVLPAGLDPEDTTVVLFPGINGEGAIQNNGLINLSAAASSWTFRIPGNSKGSLDYSQIEDIEIYLDTSGRALSGREQEAEEDSLRLQAGLELAPVDPDFAPRPTVHAPRLASPTAAVTDTISGAYFGSIVITSPLPVGIQILHLDLAESDGMLSGTVNFTETALYSGTMGLHGSVDGTAFIIASDVITTVVSGRPVQQSFTIIGHSAENNDILRGAYTGVITGLLPDPVIVEGKYSSSRGRAPGNPIRGYNFYLPMIYK